MDYQIHTGNAGGKQKITDNGTRVDFKMTYPSESDLEKIVEMVFEEGMTIGLDQLENLLRR